MLVDAGYLCRDCIQPRCPRPQTHLNRLASVNIHPQATSLTYVSYWGPVRCSASIHSTDTPCWSTTLLCLLDRTWHAVPRDLQQGIDPSDSVLVQSEDLQDVLEGSGRDMDRCTHAAYTLLETRLVRTALGLCLKLAWSSQEDHALVW